MTSSEGVLLTWIFWVLVFVIGTTAVTWWAIYWHDRKIAKRNAEHNAARRRAKRGQ